MLLLFYFQKQWEEGLQAMDQAINDMPRTKHRLYVLCLIIYNSHCV